MPNGGGKKGKKKQWFPGIRDEAGETGTGEEPGNGPWDVTKIVTSTGKEKSRFFPARRESGGGLSGSMEARAGPGRPGHLTENHDTFDIEPAKLVLSDSFGCEECGAQSYL